MLFERQLRNNDPTIILDCKEVVREVTKVDGRAIIRVQVHPRYEGFFTRFLFAFTEFHHKGDQCRIAVDVKPCGILSYKIGNLPQAKAEELWILTKTSQDLAKRSRPDNFSYRDFHRRDRRSRGTLCQCDKCLVHSPTKGSSQIFNCLHTFLYGIKRQRLGTMQNPDVCQNLSPRPDV